MQRITNREKDIKEQVINVFKWSKNVTRSIINLASHTSSSWVAFQACKYVFLSTVVKWKRWSRGNRSGGGATIITWKAERDNILELHIREYKTLFPPPWHHHHHSQVVKSQQYEACKGRIPHSILRSEFQAPMNNSKSNYNLTIYFSQLQVFWLQIL